MSDASNASPSHDTGSNREIVEMFAEEAGEQLDTLEQLLLGLENDASDATLNEAFRAMHSVKGNAGCLGLSDVEAVAHRAEDILDGLRKRSFAPNPGLMSAVLGAIDAIRNSLGDAEGGAAIPHREAIVGRLTTELVATHPPAHVPRVGELLVAAGAVDSGTAGSSMVAKPTDQLIAIGASTGGTDATRRVLARLPASSPGVVVVQHMPAGFTSMYADRLNQELSLRAVEARDGEVVMHGTVYVAPGERQCAVVRSGTTFSLRVRQAAKVSGHCPSVDVMFASVAMAAGPRAVGALLTGMGRDGADGLLDMRRAGARTLVQDEATCVVYGMPREAWKQGAAEAQVPIDEMAGEIVARLGEQREATRRGRVA